MELIEFGGLVVLLIVLLAVDVRFFAPGREATFRESVVWSIGWLALGLLVTAPVLVLISFFVGPNPMALVFNGFELGAVALAILIAVHVTQDGESTWYEGFQLLATYAVLGVVFFYA